MPCARAQRESGARYGLPATHLHWLHAPLRRSWPRPVAVALSALRVALGLWIDAWRTASWVRRHDVVIVPGMGILEANLAIRPWQEPYSLFLLTLFGRLFRTKVAMVGVGASAIPLRSSRWLLTKTTPSRTLCVLSRRVLPSGNAEDGCQTHARAGLPRPRLLAPNAGVVGASSGPLP